MALVKTVTMRVLADAGDAQAKLDELDAQAKRLSADAIKLRVRVDAPDLADLQAKLKATQAMLGSRGFTDKNIHIRVDGTGKAIADLEAVKRAADNAGGGGLFSRLGGLLGRFGGGAIGPVPLPAGLPGLAAGAGVIAGIVAALPVIDALVSGLAAAGAGAVAFGAMAYPAIQNVSQAYTQLTTAQDAFAKAQAINAMDPTKAHATALKNAADNLKYAQQQISQMGPGMSSVVTGIGNLISAGGKLSAAFQPTALKVFNAALQVANTLMPAALPFAKTFGDVLAGLLAKLDKFAQSKGFQTWLNQFHALEGPALQAIGTGIGNVVNAVGKLFTIMNAKDVSQTITVAFTVIAGAIKVLGAVIMATVQEWHQMEDGAKTVAKGVEGAWDGLVSAAKSTWHSVTSAFDAGVSYIKAIPGKIKAIFADAGSWLLSAGKAIIHGLIDGITSMLGPLEGVVSKVAGVIGKVAGWLGIHSPSTVMHGIGQNVVRGLIAGMESQLPALEAMAKKAAAVIAARVKTELAFAKSVAAATLSGLNITGIDLTQTTVAGGMQDYLQSIRAFIGELKALSAQHLNKNLLSQLIAAGPVTGGAYAQSILQGGGAAPVNALYKQIQQQAGLLGAQAAMGVYGGQVTPKGDTYIINVQGGLITDKQALALEIIKVLKEYKRHGGGTQLGIA